MEYMKKRIDVAKIISNLISAPICFGQKRKIVRKKFTDYLVKSIYQIRIKKKLLLMK